MFGMDRLEETINNQDNHEKLFENILQVVNEFIGEGERDDDITIAEIAMVDVDTLNTDYHAQNQSVTEAAQDFEFNLEFKPNTLQSFNPLPLLLHIMSLVEGMRHKSGELYTILAELYSNALEHGILGLDSKLKKSGTGFAEYYQERQKRLEGLADGYVRFTISHQYHGDQSGSLILLVEDSGAGFDYQSVLQRDRGNNDFSGRGVPLIRTLCDKFEYLDNGNKVRVQIDWSI